MADPKMFMIGILLALAGLSAVAVSTYFVMVPLLFAAVSP
jgi:hypothetical protein